MKQNGILRALSTVKTAKLQEGSSSLTYFKLGKARPPRDEQSSSPTSSGPAQTSTLQQLTVQTPVERDSIGTLTSKSTDDYVVEKLLEEDKVRLSSQWVASSNVDHC